MKTPHIEVICVGTELLTSRVNTHTAYLGQQLARFGMGIAVEHTVGDDERQMAETFRRSFQNSDVVICAGGLGPTFDDVTRDVWASILKRPLQLDPHLLRDIREKFKARRVPMPPMNQRQAYVLKGASPLANVNGTAPGQILFIGKKILILLPGPSRELYPMVESFVLPHLKVAFPSLQTVQKSFHMVGVPESRIDALIRPVIGKSCADKSCRVVHGILASQGIITVKFQVNGSDLARVSRVADRLALQLRRKVRPWLLGEDADTLEEAVAKRFIHLGKTLAVAESCTGGLVAKLLTDIPGTSQFLLEGVVTYSNRSKQERLHVSAHSLNKFGAVSEPVARQMADGLKKTSGADYTVSITGIAGPDGGSEKKPVGLVYIGLAGPKRTTVKEFRFGGERGWIRQRAALMALDLLRQELA